MKLERFAYLMGDAVAEIYMIDGLIFLDRMDRGIDGLKREIETYASTTEAQRWLNLALFDQAISEIAGEEWEPSDPSIDAFLEIFRRAWTFQIRAKFPDITFQISTYRDDEHGDLGLRLIQ